MDGGDDAGKGGREGRGRGRGRGRGSGREGEGEGEGRVGGREGRGREGRGREGGGRVGGREGRGREGRGRGREGEGGGRVGGREGRGREGGGRLGGVEYDKKINKPCRNGTNCKKQDCPFDHGIERNEKKGAKASSTACPEGTNCSKKDSCPYIHEECPEKDICREIKCMLIRKCFHHFEKIFHR